MTDSILISNYNDNTSILQLNMITKIYVFSYHQFYSLHFSHGIFINSLSNKILLSIALFEVDVLTISINSCEFY